DRLLVLGNRCAVWYRANQLSLNADKTELILFSSPRTDFSGYIFMDFLGTRIRSVDKIKYLGVFLDKNLNFKDEVHRISLLLAPYVYLFANLRKVLPTRILLLLYNALVLSHINYSIALWSQTFKVILHEVQIIQNKIVRSMFNIRKRDSVSHVLVVNNML